MAREVDPIKEAQRFLLDRLSNEAAIVAIVGARIGSAPLPRETPYPILTYQYLQRGRDSFRVVNGLVLLHDLLFLVKGVGEGFETADLETLSVETFNVLHKASGLVPPSGDSLVISCLHERSIRYPETTQSRQFQHLGAEYRIAIQIPGDGWF